MTRLTPNAARLLCALIATAALSTPALAERPGRDRGVQIQHTSHRHTPKAGTIRIGRDRFVIDSRRVDRQIARAFRKAGYRAWIEDGKVYARYGWDCRPNVRWTTGTHSASIRYRGDCVIVDTSRCGAPRTFYKPKPACKPWRPARRRSCGW